MVFLFSNFQTSSVMHGCKRHPGPFHSHRHTIPERRKPSPQKSTPATKPFLPYVRLHAWPTQTERNTAINHTQPTMPTKGMVTQHTVQPKIAPKPENLPARSPQTPRTPSLPQPGSSATLPNYFFHETGPLPIAPSYRACNTIFAPCMSGRGLLRPYHTQRVTQDPVAL